MLYALTLKEWPSGDLKGNHGAAAGIRTRVPGCFLDGMGSRCHRPGYPPYLNQELRYWLWTTAANQAHQPIVCKHFRSVGVVWIQQCLLRMSDYPLQEGFRWISGQNSRSSRGLS